MTIPTSTVPSAVSAIVTAIQAQLTANSEGAVLLCVGDPSMNDPNDIIEVASDIRKEQRPGAIVGGGGLYALEEVYEIDVVASSARETVNVVTDDLALLDRATTLAGYIETAIRTDMSLGGVVNQAYPSRWQGGTPEWAENEVGRVSEITVTIHCEALN